jgi:hypothetical protein
MITSAECKTYSDNCHAVATDPEVSIRRATAAMAVCRILIQLGAELTTYERIIVDEG